MTDFKDTQVTKVDGGRQKFCWRKVFINGPSSLWLDKLTLMRGFQTIVERVLRSWEKWSAHFRIHKHMRDLAVPDANVVSLAIN